MRQLHGTPWQYQESGKIVWNFDHLQRLKASLISVCLGMNTCLASDSDHLFDMSIEELSRIPITAATLTEQSIISVPAAATLFTHSQIEKMGIDYLHELLNFVPGYQNVRSSEWPTLGTYSSRGRRTGAGSKEILLLIDGRPINDPRSGTANEVISLIPLTQFERIEVIRGPGSALYGSNAFTGVLNLISRKDSEAEIHLGNLDQRGGRLLYHDHHEDWQFNAFLSANRDNGDDFIAPDTFAPFSSMAISDPLANQHLDVRLQYRDTHLSFQHRGNESDGFYMGATLSESFNHLDTQFDQFSVLHQHQWRDDFYSEFSLFYQQTQQNIQSLVLPEGALASVSTPASSAPFYGKAVFEGESVLARWHNVWQRHDRAEFLFGVEWQQQEETRNQAYTNYNLQQLASQTFPVEYYGGLNYSIPLGLEQSRQAAGVYGQYQSPWWHDTQFTLGGRYDDYSDAGGRFNPRAAVVHRLDPQNALKLLYGEAFRAPAINETTGLINNPAIVGNPDLSHEIVKTWDVIYLLSLSNLSISTGWFRNRYEDPIIPGLIGTTRTFINGEDQTSEGLEFEFNYQPHRDWVLRGSITRLYELPESAFKEAQNLGSLIIFYHQPRWTLNFCAVYHGERESLVSSTPSAMLTFDDYVLINAKATYKPTVQSSWQVHLQAKNLLNEEYFMPAENSALTTGIPGRGLEITAGVTYQFR